MTRALGRNRKEHEKKIYRKMLSGAGDREKKLNGGGDSSKAGVWFGGARGRGWLGGGARIALLSFCLLTLALFFHFLLQV